VSTSQTVTIVDYGVGNLFSVRGALEHCGAELMMAETAAEIENAERLLLPGVGAFGAAMKDMRDNNLVEPVKAFVEAGRPLLGICLGMQMLMGESEEFGINEGLGLVPGPVLAIPETGKDGQPHQVPHVGWSPLSAGSGAGWDGTILDGLTQDSEMYFVHSFSTHPENPDHTLARCDYNGRDITAVVQADNVLGCQFHPEKSGEKGFVILHNFLNL
jgi:glutamine amidotransferase